MSDLVLVGVAIILAGMVALVASTFGSSQGERKTEVRGGGVVLIGPIPIIFGSDMKWASIAIVLAIALVVLVVSLGVLG